MKMFRDISENVKDYDDDEELSAYLEKIVSGEAGDGSRKIYGLGHAVYTLSDPRAEIIKTYAANIAEKKGYSEQLKLMRNIERLGIPIIMNEKKLLTPICSNVARSRKTHPRSFRRRAREDDRSAPYGALRTRGKGPRYGQDAVYAIKKTPVKLFTGVFKNLTCGSEIRRPRLRNCPEGAGARA